MYAKTIERYSSLPYYRKGMESGGFNADQLAAIGDEREIRDAARRYRDAGATLPGVGPFAGHPAAAGFEATLVAAAGG